jgi:hypothetical protein
MDPFGTVFLPRHIYLLLFPRPLFFSSSSSSEKILNSSRFLKARSNQRPAADHVGHRDFMDHLKNTLSSGDMDLPGGARAPKVQRSSAAPTNYLVIRRAS